MSSYQVRYLAGIWLVMYGKQIMYWSRLREDIEAWLDRNGNH